MLTMSSIDKSWAEIMSLQVKRDRTIRNFVNDIIVEDVIST